MATDSDSLLLPQAIVRNRAARGLIFDFDGTLKFSCRAEGVYLTAARLVL